MAAAERLLLIASPLMHRTPAFDRAAALAKVKRAPLQIVAFDYIEGIAEAGLITDAAISEIRKDYVEAHHAWLEEQAQGMRHLGVSVTTEVKWVKRPVEEVPNNVRELRPSMVIKDLQHEPWHTRALFTTLDRRLLYECEAPLHLIAKAQRGIPRSIVAAVDPFQVHDHFDYLNERIITLAQQLARQCQAQLHLLSVYDLSYVFARDGAWGYEPLVAHQLYDDGQSIFAELGDRFGVRPEHRHMAVGDPAKALEAFMLKSDIDVAVLGSVHRDLVHRLLGSTTERVANHLYSSLVTVNPRSSAMGRTRR